jgi:hypothetical protein
MSDICKTITQAAAAALSITACAYSSSINVSPNAPWASISAPAFAVSITRVAGKLTSSVFEALSLILCLHPGASKNTVAGFQHGHGLVVHLFEHGPGKNVHGCGSAVVRVGWEGDFEADDTFVGGVGSLYLYTSSIAGNGELEE